MIDPLAIVNECYKKLPQNLKEKPWEATDHGRAVLQTEDQLNAYLAAYGEIHIIKCLAALQNLPIDDFKNYSYEIFDWGCGQGIASLVLVDFLYNRNLLGRLKKITLIEPSSKAIERAQNLIKHAVGPGIEIATINKYLPTNAYEKWEELTGAARVSINLFSNILDVPQINLAWLANRVSTLAEKNYMICVGPKFSYNTRIQDFCGYFTPTSYFSNIEESTYAYTSRTHHPFSCETKCFLHLKNQSLDNNYIEAADHVYYDDYDYSEECYRGVLPDSVIELYSKFKKYCAISYDIFIRPSIGVNKPDFLLANPYKGIVIANVCDDVSNFECEWQRVEKIKEFIFDTHLKNIKIDSIANQSVYGCVHTALYFPNSSDLEVEDKFRKVIQDAEEKDRRQIEKNYRYLIKLYSDTPINKRLNNLSSQSFKSAYYKELLKLITGNWHSYKDGNQNFQLSNRQKEFVKGDKLRIRVVGVAGSGKTQVVANRAVERHIKTGSKVLIITYNITLIECIRMRINQVPADFATSMFEITNYHQFFTSMANRYSNKKITLEDYDNADFFTTYENKLEKYQTIIIDEAQDFKSSWFDVIKSFLSEGGSIAFFGDSGQNTYNRERDEETKMPPIRHLGFSGEWPKLTENISYRIQNPQLVLLAGKFSRQFIDSKSIINQPTFDFSEYSIEYKSIPMLNDIDCIFHEIESFIDKHELKYKDIAILSPVIPIVRDLEYYCRTRKNIISMISFETKEQYEALLGNKFFKDDIDAVRRVAKTHFTTQDEHIKIATIQSFKGWEANTVILLLPEMNNLHEQSNVPELIYTGITRARQNLLILSIGDNQYNNFFSQSI
ncbi:MAG: AAA family ATPase [Paludibacteraceae bacterium]|nr:AAA family ATPase [Paludibacteraceae bacterium]